MMHKLNQISIDWDLHFGLLIIINFIASFVIGQVSIEGVIHDEKLTPVPRINVLIYIPGNPSLIAFAVSDDNGYFQTNVTSKSDSLLLIISSVAHRNDSSIISNTSQNLSFYLVPEVRNLKSFTVNASPIERHGDTISYLVSSFSGNEDRVIEDVLKKMPGIEVDPNGTILYQGEPIKKFYVEGLDLMEGRYSVISKNLPEGAVGVVEIIENHQPIRILEDRISSTQASLNLKLKKGVASTGTAHAGLGYQPFLWDINVTPMIFTKKFQLLTSYQSNNSGNDISQQLRVLTVDDLAKTIDRPNKHSNILDIRKVSPPDIERNRYLDNNIHLLNLNGLVRINNDMQLRSNLFYINDMQNQVAEQKNTIYTATDTINFTEKFDNSFHYNYLFAETSLNRNTKSNYLNNDLKIESNWDETKGQIIRGNDQISQTLKYPFISVSNELRSINPIGKHLVEFNSYLSVDKNSHNLQVLPGQFTEIFNSGQDYKQIDQQIYLDRFYTDNSASLVLGWGKFVLIPKTGLMYRYQSLSSHIFTTINDTVNTAPTSFTNYLRGNQLQAYLNLGGEYERRKITIKAKLPLRLQYVYMSDPILVQNQEISRLFLNPSISFEYRINSLWNFRGYWGYNSKVGDMDEVHYGYILRNYRDLSQFAAPLSIIESQHLSFRLAYRNLVSSFFNTISYVYSNNESNITYDRYILDNGTSLVRAIDNPMFSFSHNLQAYSSKFIPKIRSTLSIRAYYSLIQSQSLINDDLFITESKLLLLRPSASIRVSPWLNIEYLVDVSTTRTYVEGEKKNNIEFVKHQFNLFAFPFIDHQINIVTEYYQYSSTDYYFLDISYKYSFNRPELELEFRWNNILNTTSYTTYNVSGSSLLESTYVIRPSQILATIRFNF